MVESTDVEMKPVDEASSASTPEAEVKKDPDLLTIEGMIRPTFIYSFFRRDTSIFNV